MDFEDDPIIDLQVTSELDVMNKSAVEQFGVTSDNDS
jgi:hypothetical protein